MELPLIRMYLQKTVQEGGRNLTMTIRQNVENVGIHLTDIKNRLRFLEMANTYELLKEISELIETRSIPSEREKYLTPSGQWDRTKIIFGMRFISDELVAELGHGFNLTIASNDRGRVLSLSFSIKLSDEELKFYENYCNEHKDKFVQAAMAGELEEVKH